MVYLLSGVAFFAFGQHFFTWVLPANLFYFALIFFAVVESAQSRQMLLKSAFDTAKFQRKVRRIFCFNWLFLALNIIGIFSVWVILIVFLHNEEDFSKNVPLIFGYDFVWFVLLIPFYLIARRQKKVQEALKVFDYDENSANESGEGGGMQNGMTTPMGGRNTGSGDPYDPGGIIVSL